MTAYSQNLWTANDRSVIASYSLPGGRVALRAGDVSVVLLWCATQWHARVEPLVWPGIWGYAERPIRGGTTLSNHASGTAIDLNAPKHPLGTAPAANFTARQIAEVRSIVGYCDGVVRWGGDYTGRKDGMHLEINAGAAAVKRVADKIRAAAVTSAKPVPNPPDPYIEDDDVYLKCESTKGGPIWVGLLSGGVLIGPLTPGEIGSADLNVNEYGALVQWVERATWDRLAARSA